MRATGFYRLHTARCLMGAAVIAGFASFAQAAEFASSIELSSLNGATGFKLNGVLANDLAGYSVGAAGDVNGDGFGDVIVGAYLADAAPGFDQGAAYVVFGSATGLPSVIDLSALDGTTGFALRGAENDDQAGASVTSAGDVNGDGYGDLIVGAYRAGVDRGAAYVVFGNAGPFASVVNLSALNGDDGFKINGAADGDYAGTSVAAGDVNGDGFSDIIVGAPNADGPGTNSGEAYVIFGTGSAFQPVIELSALAIATGFKINGGAAGDQVGVAVAAGDFNGDGKSDLMVGAYDADGAVANAGAAFVIFGKAASFGTGIELSALTSGAGFTLAGVASFDRTGLGVAAAGDVNGDGFGDMIIGAYLADTPGIDSGAAYVVFGKAGSFGSGLNLSALNGSTGFLLNGAADGDHAGRSVAAAGDVNGDGFADMMVGARKAETPGIDSGETYVVFGKPSFGSVIELSGLNGTTGFKLNGESGVVAAGVKGDWAGQGVAGAGDVNGDGFGDVIVGAPYADGSVAESGAAYVLYGRRPDAAVTRIGAAANQYISGGNFADTLSGVGGKDGLEGRGGGDKLKGGNGSNTASYEHAPAGVVANLGSPSANTGHAHGDKYTSIQNLMGSRLNDKLTGDGSNNRITGGMGRDRLKGQGGKDIFTYRFASESLPAARDVIVDFNPGTASSSVDKIDVSAVDANAVANGNQAFIFRGTKAFNEAGQLRLKKTSAGIVVQGNTNSSAAPEFEILLKGLGSTSAITAKDFKL